MKKFIFTLTLCAAACNSAAFASTLVTPERATQMLNKHEQHFDKRIVQVAPNVYTAIGYHGATTSMIVGDDGVIMIDSLMGPTSASNALKDFRQYSDKPVKAIIYTHSHGDHTGGAKAYAGASDVKVIGPANMGHHHGTDKVLDQIQKKREVRQFGRKLPPHEQSNRGVAPAVTIDHDRGTGFIKPTIEVKGDYKTRIAGIDIEIYAAAGETNDAMFIWLPNQKVLFSGDNFYQAFPNLYAIRGTPYRDVRTWSRSVARMAGFEPMALVGGHTTPILGQQKATAALKDYSEAIQSVFDQTVAGMNKGLDPVTIAQSVELPAHLRDKPYLTEFYGTVGHASRAIFAGMFGWFDGNPTNLNPMSNADTARQFARLAGGTAKLQANLEKAMKAEDYQWALVLTDHLSYLDGVDQYKNRDIKIKALRGMAVRDYNAPNRNYYFTYANELEALQKAVK
ncbi:alkyl sulfatase dimerization domain-containing protein [Shewanella sp. GXUN23E]|uniref:alkyl sulfatase dimerization domain-containing protein n=1 Tax=Shewanella sp. GXUN23E TaxID=3422498 RepID=UPI003D7C6353